MPIFSPEDIESGKAKEMYERLGYDKIPRYEGPKMSPDEALKSLGIEPK